MHNCWKDLSFGLDAHPYTLSENQVMVEKRLIKKKEPECVLKLELRQECVLNQNVKKKAHFKKQEQEWFNICPSSF